MQNSVFECKVDAGQFATLKAKLLGIVDLESDSIRFYHLGSTWDQRVDHHGTKPSMNPDGPLIVCPPAYPKRSWFPRTVREAEFIPSYLDLFHFPC